jgi:hypothetical protein
MDDIKYFVFDIESIADGELISRLRYPTAELDPAAAVAQYREELLEEKGSDFIPPTYHLPISLVVGKVNAEFQLVDLVALDEPECRPPEITRLFWSGWEAYKKPTFVTFNGRSFDIPVMELAAFRYGLSLKEWFAWNARNFDQPRYRFNHHSHLDLQEVLSNFGAARLNGGLNLIANLIGKPGKMDVAGDMVQDLYEQGALPEINNYCRCDVLDTYFVFLRTNVLIGKLSLERELHLVQQTRSWLESQATDNPIFEQYLNNWGDWKNPWATIKDE